MQVTTAIWKHPGCQLKEPKVKGRQAIYTLHDHYGKHYIMLTAQVGLNIHYGLFLTAPS